MSKNVFEAALATDVKIYDKGLKAMTEIKYPNKITANDGDRMTENDYKSKTIRAECFRIDKRCYDENSSSSFLKRKVLINMYFLYRVRVRNPGILHNNYTRPASVQRTMERIMLRITVARKQVSEFVIKQE